MGIKTRNFVEFKNFRFSFNSQEKDDEISGKGNSYSAEFWQYDSRLGRRWNLDPKPYSSISDYVCFANDPILFDDPLGDDFFAKGKKKQKQTQESLSLAFQGTAKVGAFSFDKKGKLSVDETLVDKSKFTKEQAFLYKSFVTDIVMNTEVSLTLKNSILGSPNTIWTDWQGKDYTETITNYGKVDASVTINVNFRKNGGKFKDVAGKQRDLTKEEKYGIIFWHEIGHFSAYQKGDSYKTDAGIKLNNKRAVGMENIFRSAMGLPDREGNKHAVGFPGAQGSLKPKGY